MQRPAENPQSPVPEAANRLSALMEEYEKRFGQAAQTGAAFGALMSGILRMAEEAQNREEIDEESFDWDSLAAAQNTPRKTGGMLCESAVYVQKMEEQASVLGLGVLSDVTSENRIYGPGTPMEVPSGRITLEVKDPQKFTRAMQELAEAGSETGAPDDILLKVIQGVINSGGAAVNLDSVRALGDLHETVIDRMPSYGRLSAFCSLLSCENQEPETARALVGGLKEGDALHCNFTIIATGDATHDFIRRALDRYEVYKKRTSAHASGSMAAGWYLKDLEERLVDCLSAYLEAHEQMRGSGRIDEAHARCFDKAIELARSALAEKTCGGEGMIS